MMRETFSRPQYQGGPGPVYVEDSAANDTGGGYFGGRLGNIRPPGMGPRTGGGAQMVPRNTGIVPPGMATGGPNQPIAAVGQIPSNPYAHLAGGSPPMMAAPGMQTGGALPPMQQPAMAPRAPTMPPGMPPTIYGQPTAGLSPQQLAALVVRRGRY